MMTSRIGCIRSAAAAMLLALLAACNQRVQASEQASDPGAPGQRAAPAGDDALGWVETGVAPPPAADEQPGDDDEPAALRFDLAAIDAARTGPDGAEPAPALVAAEPLDAARVEELLARVPPLPEEEGDVAPFRFRDQSLPPPLTGEVVAEVFPPPAEAAGPPPVTSRPLEVLRRAPEGGIDVAPGVSITFSLPMVPLTAVDELRAAVQRPLRIDPEPAGQWRWLDTRTLVFEPEGGRLPAATQYTFEVPADARAAGGERLGRAVRWTATTPPPRLLEAHPRDQVTPVDPLVVLFFDQRVDARAVLPHLTLRAGGERRELRLATDGELRESALGRRLADATHAFTWVALRAVEELPYDSRVTVVLEEGLPSAEGPRVTQAPQQLGFRTHGAFAVTGTRCGWGDRCRPRGGGLGVVFNHELDAQAFDAAQLDVSPAIEDMTAAASGNTLWIGGRLASLTTYRVRLDPGLRDVYGQTLGPTEPLRFDVGLDRPTVASPGGWFAVLDPYADASWSLWSLNCDALRVRLYRVGPDDWDAFAADFARRDPFEWSAPPGELVLDERLAIEAEPGELVETRVPLGVALRDGRGSCVLDVQPIFDAALLDEGERVAPVRAWLQRTAIGLDVVEDGHELLVWASDLRDGSPAADVEVALAPDGATARTDERGLATLALPEGSAPDGSRARRLVARAGADVALLPESLSPWQYHRTGLSNWCVEPGGEQLVIFAADDRALYQPGEEVHLKGWLRPVGFDRGGDVRALPGGVETVDWTARDPRGNDIASGSAAVNAFGGFDLAFAIPDDSNLGTGHVAFEVDWADAPGAPGAGAARRQSAVHAFRIEEFRVPEYEVEVAARTAPYFVDGRADVLAQARYYAGGGLPATPVAWTVTAQPGWFTPPNRDDFHFGPDAPWWGAHRGGAAGPTQHTLETRTDEQGRSEVRLQFEGAPEPRAWSVTAEAAVTDVNQQRWADAAELLVHPAELYVGLRSGRGFARRGEPVTVDAIVVDLDGRAVSGQPIRVTAVRQAWVQRQGEWQLEEAERREQALTSAAEPVSATFAQLQGGQWIVTARIHDAQQRANESALSIWVPGGDGPPDRELEGQQVRLVADAESYQPGEVAEILVGAPFAPAEGLLTVERSGVVASQRFAIDTTSATVRVPIEPGHVPGVTVRVLLAGAVPRTDETGEVLAGPPRPAFAQGELPLQVPPLARTLAVEVTPRATELAPGAETAVQVAVRGADGEPVAGEVALFVVDEAVLALTGYELPDPLEAFYPWRWPATAVHRLREHLVLAAQAALEDEDVLEEDSLGMLRQLGYNGGGAADESAEFARAGAPAAAPAALTARARADAVAKGAGEAPVITERRRFDPLAHFAASVRTGDDGRATVALTLPDSLTRYRVMALATDGARRFGRGEAALTARLPLMVRPSPPRFLNYGDVFELPIVVQNATDAALSVDVAARCVNARFTAGAGRRVTVPPRDRVEVRLPAAAADPGTARFQLVAVAVDGDAADAARVDLPVWTPATTEAFAVYGQLDQGAVAQPVAEPQSAVDDFGGLELTTSSTAVAALTDALLYLVDYPFGCSEQIASRILAVASLRDVLAAFGAEQLPPADEIEAAVQRDLAALAELQNGDGGFGFWSRGQPSEPFPSVHVALALVVAQRAGYELPDGVLDRSRGYLRRIGQHVPDGYPDGARRAIEAFALNVRWRAGEPDLDAAQRLVRGERLDELSAEAVGWLLPVLASAPAGADDVARARRFLLNRVAETAAGAHMTTATGAVLYGGRPDLLLHGDRRADGVVLDALVTALPDSDLIPKLVRGLLAHRTRGHWGSTQENAFVLLALRHYFDVFEAVEPDFVARAWLGERYAGEQAFVGRGTERHHLLVPMAQLHGTEPLVLSKEGPGRLYWRLGLRYAPAELRLAAADRGFAVERLYTAVDDPDDVRRDDDGTWRVRRGATVKVAVTMLAPSARAHVALVDPLPAGFEPLNPALAVTGAPPTEPGDGPPRPPSRTGRAMHASWWWWGPWYGHQNLRDERVEAFASWLPAGVYRYEYYARATTPGRFVVPPARAEEMYTPETFGRSASAGVVVE